MPQVWKKEAEDIEVRRKTSENRACWRDIGGSWFTLSGNNIFRFNIQRLALFSLPIFHFRISDSFQTDPQAELPMFPFSYHSVQTDPQANYSRKCGTLIQHSWNAWISYPFQLCWCCCERVASAWFVIAVAALGRLIRCHFVRSHFGSRGYGGVGS